MKLSAWLFLTALVLLSLLFSMFRRNAHEQILPNEACGIKAPGHAKASPLLCGEKISLRSASAYDFASLKGISLKTGRLIASYVKAHPEADIEELLHLPGVGPKTLLLLQSTFSPSQSSESRE